MHLLVEHGDLKIVKKRYYFIIPLYFFFIGCISDGSYDEVLTSKYSLIGIDGKNNMTISYNDGEGFIGVINATVFAVGVDNDYIIAKQHPRAEWPKVPNKKITYYYIIPLKIKMTVLPNKNVIGPLTKNEFIAKRMDLGISEKLSFTKVFKELHE